MMSGLYWYLTDFCINAANLLGITYSELNFALFIVLFPATLVVLGCVNAVKLGLWLFRR